MYILSAKSSMEKKKKRTYKAFLEPNTENVHAATSRQTFLRWAKHSEGNEFVYFYLLFYSEYMQLADLHSCAYCAQKFGIFFHNVPAENVKLG